MERGNDTIIKLKKRGIYKEKSRILQEKYSNYAILDLFVFTESFQFFG